LWLWCLMTKCNDDYGDNGRWMMIVVEGEG
ncbi:hypothetical protein A2U01_0106711, partial [Trifolium medium]|nr:hypothetical protein [Trifolium medium]